MYSSNLHVYRCVQMINFDAVDFSECHSKQVISFFFDAQCTFNVKNNIQYAIHV